MRVFAIALIITAFIGGSAGEPYKHVIINADSSSAEENDQSIGLLITAHFPEENPFHRTRLQCLP